ncbi:hypothetical protein G9A89_012905 [Geosiphon pyriformis]|nr:hypothetical protein G9A89_012905 [Geosiphon pyriformis]
MQQQFPIIYANKGKGRIQTPATIPKGIQLPSWKKHRVELPTTPLYHYTPESTINILSADTSTSNNPDLTNQPNISPNIVINHPPIDPIVKLIQQPLQQPNLQIQQPQGPPQQPPLQQQPLQQPQQQLNVNQMAYASIAKLENFTSEKDDA